MSTSDTPRTERHRNCSNPNMPEEVVAWNFARQLERELTAAQARIAELEGWKQSQLSVESEWDAQEIGRLLGLTPASSIRQGIMERVPELVADKARLDWLEEWHLSLSRLTSPDMSGLRFVGQYFNPAKMRGEAGPSYLRIQGSTIRAAIDQAMTPPPNNLPHA